jgi:uncharacterized membrane protein (UPF0127 family)
MSSAYSRFSYLPFFYLIFLFVAPFTFANPLPSVSINGKSLKVEVADEEHEVIEGLMFRESLPEDQGMIFVFPREMPLSFWMKNTSIPLSVAYLDKNLIIQEIYNLYPYDTTKVHSKATNLRYALEVNQGWFRKNGIKAGDKVILD